MMQPVNFADRTIAQQLLARIHALAKRAGPCKIMEVCGTHTMEIGRLGLRRLLPPSIELLSGPGCPVCVTPAGVIDAAIDLCRRSRVVLATFGDMVRVPGSSASLEQAKAAGGNVLVVTSPLALLDIAANDPASSYVFAAVGFETTIPVVARTVQQALERKLNNLYFLVAHRTIPPALAALCAERAITLNGFLLPGHVSAILGRRAYEKIPGLTVPAAITGFEPLDILLGIHSVLQMLAKGKSGIANEYCRAVKPDGNPAARAAIAGVFEPADAQWRGIGMIPQSGLALRTAYADLDAAKRFGISASGGAMPEGCSCGAVLRGIISPLMCPLFARACTPQSPVGPCMVSSEGSCAAYYRYERTHR